MANTTYIFPKLISSFVNQQDKLTIWYESGADTPVLMLNPGLSNEEISFALSAFRPLSGLNT